MEEEVDVDTSAHAMEVEEYIEVPPTVDPNAQIPQIQWQDEENVHEVGHIHVEEPLGEIKQLQEEIIQTQQHTHQLAEIDAKLEDLWTHLVPPPPPPPFDPALAPPQPPFYRNPPY
ncbi:hypothetical protein Acr_11g0009250 [Actinidia rufa]|uniref:Uncharacterized protein n=1 Tax=Actinidia rufa TaxID=165716 RepID=A0A7J0FEM1_9ERIC|nr:hypothetical protein Acr_11g0009250 [Actinidia rufa]